MSYDYYANRLLFILRAANLQITTDQAFVKLGTFTNYRLLSGTGRVVTGGVTIACAGGIYTAASKGGTPLIAAAFAWTGLTGAGKIVDLTLAAVVATDVQTATPILNLTTGSTGACTSDIYLYGVPLD